MDIESKILSGYITFGAVLFLAAAVIYWDATALIFSVVCTIARGLIKMMSPDQKENS